MNPSILSIKYIFLSILVYSDLLHQLSNRNHDENNSSFNVVLSRYRPLFNISLYEDDDLLQDNQSNKYKNDWPTGTYGLPKPINGCPHDSILWKKGWRYHDTENNNNDNSFSQILHLDGSVTEQGILHKFCIKTHPNGEGNWPKGRYCFYQFNNKCPDETKPGFVFWDDENDDNHNRFSGTLPTGSFTTDTEIRFCCKIDGDPSKPIRLPKKYPFYLFPYISSNCQQVEGMNVNLEFIKFDNEDTLNQNSQGGEYPFGIDPTKEDIYYYLCYYWPKDQQSILTNNSSVVKFSNKSIHFDINVNKKVNKTDTNKTFKHYIVKKILAILLAILSIVLISLLLVYIYMVNWRSSMLKKSNIHTNKSKITVQKNTLTAIDFPEFDAETTGIGDTPLAYDHTLDNWGGSKHHIEPFLSQQPY